MSGAPNEESNEALDPQLDREESEKETYDHRAAIKKRRAKARKDVKVKKDLE